RNRRPTTDDRRPNFCYLAVGGRWSVVGGLEEVLGGDRSVVQVAVAPAHIAPGVMARRPAKRIYRPLALVQQRCAGQRDIGGGTGGSIRAGDDRCAQIEGVV